MTDIIVRPILAPEERTRRDELVEVVRRGARAFLDVGRALREIRDARLYRDRAETFEEFVKVEFDLGRQYAYRLIGAAGAHDTIAMSPMGDTARPDSERVLRPLASLSEDKVVEAWGRAVELAAGGPVTHKHVKAALEGQATPAAPGSVVSRFVAACKRFETALAAGSISAEEAEPVMLALSGVEVSLRHARERHEVALPPGQRSLALVRSARRREAPAESPIEEKVAPGATVPEKLTLVSRPAPKPRKALPRDNEGRPA